MRFIFLITVVLIFVYSSIASPIVRSVPDNNEAAYVTGKAFDTTSLVPRDLQDWSNGFDDNPFSVITLVPSLIYPEGTTGASFLVFNPEPTEHPSAAEQIHRSSSSTATTSRLTAGIIRPLSDYTTQAASTQSPKTQTNPNENTQTQTQAQSITSRPVGSIVPFTNPEDQTTSKALLTSGSSSLSTEPAFTTTAATHQTTAPEKTTTVYATSTTTATAVVTITNPVTVPTTTTTTTTTTATVTAATTEMNIKTKKKTVTTTMTRCSSSSPTGVDVIPADPTGLTSSPTTASTTTATEATRSSYRPTGVDVIPVHPTWLTTSEPSTTDDAAITSYSPTGVDVIPVHPTWATGV